MFNCFNSFRCLFKFCSFKLLDFRVVRLRCFFDFSNFWFVDFSTFSNVHGLAWQSREPVRVHMTFCAQEVVYREVTKYYSNFISACRHELKAVKTIFLASNFWYDFDCHLLSSVCCACKYTGLCIFAADTIVLYFHSPKTTAAAITATRERWLVTRGYIWCLQCKLYDHVHRISQRLPA